MITLSSVVEDTSRTNEATPETRGSAAVRVIPPFLYGVWTYSKAAPLTVAVSGMGAVPLALMWIILSSSVSTAKLKVKVHPLTVKNCSHAAESLLKSMPSQGGKTGAGAGASAGGSAGSSGTSGATVDVIGCTNQIFDD